MRVTRTQRCALLLLLVLCAWGFFYRLGNIPLLDDPNEGEYAEVAREMLESGDWLTPRLNYAVFLNKPPLTGWAIAVGDLVFGINELSARLPSAGAALVIILLVVRLGTVLFDFETGLLAGCILFATAGFFLEAHQVRPDLLMTAGIVGGVLAFAHLRASGPTASRRALIGLQVALAVGVLAKGLTGFVLPGLVFGALLISERRFDLLRQLLRPRAWWLFVVLVVPWPAWIAVKEPGFLWDYIVNQHLLFFFDRKVPRDSIPMPLGEFWTIFGARLFPWTVLVPLALVIAARRARMAARGNPDRLLLAWAAVVLLFFSAASSRLEHYSIPAIPAVALLLAKLFRDYVEGGSRSLDRGIVGHLVVTAALIIIAAMMVPHAIAAQPWLSAIPDLTPIGRHVFTILAAGGVAAAVLGLVRRRRWVVPAVVASFALTIPAALNGVSLLSRINSSAAFARAMQAVSDPDDKFVLEAPVEYQNCAGLNFYTGRKLLLLAHHDFVPPPYLAPHMDELFISRAELDQLWQDERVFFITDPLAPRTVLDGTVPQPRYIVLRDHVRWAVTNRPLH